MFQNSCNLLILQANFNFYRRKSNLKWLRQVYGWGKTKLTKLNLKPNQPNHPKTLGSYYFCQLSLYSYMGEESQTKQIKPKTNHPKPPGLSYFCYLSLNTKFQLRRLCLSCISMVEEEKKKKKMSSFRGYLSPAQIELS